ncbi:MAG: hypothetical protein ACYTFI_08930 [Planctomycetota bacterium]|jgi:hypothetical protein
MRPVVPCLLSAALCIATHGCTKTPPGNCTLHVVLAGAEGDAITVCLAEGNLTEPKQAEGYGPEYEFGGLSPGRYLITLEPDSEDWDTHCIGYREVEVTGRQHTVAMTVARHRLIVKVRFTSLPAPKHRKDLAVARVDKVLGGKVDPIYKQWLFVKPENDTWTGELFYMDSGRYRITFFTVEYGRLLKGVHTTDICSKDVVLDAAALARGSITLDF